MDKLLASTFYINHADRMVESYKLLTGNDLFSCSTHPDGTELSNIEKMQTADFVLLSHGLGPDPIFNYANPLALELFELSWTELINLPSRLSAEAINQVERAALLKTVNQQGYIDNYSGVRISAKGRRFKINQAIVWNIVDANGKYFGQAARFKEWDFL